MADLNENKSSTPGGHWRLQIHETKKIQKKRQKQRSEQRNRDEVRVQETAEYLNRLWRRERHS